MLNIGLVGAFDRDNYGDLLFPIISEQIIGNRLPNANFTYYSLIERDMNDISGFITKSIKQLYVDKPEVIILVGGDIINADWKAMELNTFSNRKKIISYRVFYKLIGNKNAQKIAKKNLGGKTFYPWLLTKSIFADSKIIYNAVGGSKLLHLDKEILNSIALALKEADYVSVRDNTTKSNLETLGVDSVYLSPDSAFIMSDIYNQESLDEKMTFNFNNWSKREISSKNGYVVFQVGKSYAKGNEKIIAEQLVKFSKKTELDVVLLPIGLAQGHEDDVPLNEIYKLVNKEINVVKVFKRNIFDIIRIISMSRLFIGTSLHGNITALSYSVPSIGLDSRITKLSSFLRDFSIPEQEYGVPYNEICSSGERSLNITKEKLYNNSKLLKQSVDNNFNNIIKIIKKGDIF